MRVVAVAVAIAIAASPAIADDKAALTGTVVDETGAPVVGVTVLAGGHLAVTDDDGRFVFDTLRPGAVRVVLEAPWIVRRAITERLVSGERRDVRYVVKEDLDEEQIDIEGTAPLDPGKQRVGAKQARQIPGTSGDALKVVQSMPGVARPPPGSADIVVWGAAPRDTRVFVDGVPIPALYHVGGWRSAVGGELVSEIALEPGAFGARYGDAIGGIVDVTTDVPAKGGVVLAADVLDASAAAFGVAGTTRIAASARASWLDRVVERAAPDVGDLVPVPRWADAHVAVAHPVGGGELRGFVLASGDRLERVVDSDDPAAVKRQDTTRVFGRAGVSWRGDRAGGTANASAWVGFDDDRLSLRFGAVPANLDITSVLGGGRAEHTSRHGDHVVVTLGADATIARGRVHRDGSLGTPAREGDVAIFGQPPGDDVAADDWQTTTIDAAPHVTVDYVRGRFSVSPSLRLDGYVIGASRLLPRVGTAPAIGYQAIVFEPAPRLSSRIAAGPFAFTADAGVYHQARLAGDASAVFGTPTLGLERALHAAVGVALRLRERIDVELVGYARELDDLVARHPASTPPLAGALTQDGSGRVVGGQLVAKLLPWHGLAGWIAYGVSRSERRDAPDMRDRLFDRDQTHLGTAVVGWSHGGWSTGARLRVASGEPRTPVIGAFVDARTGSYQPIVGATNAIRLPAFVQLDVRGERRFDVRGELAIYLELQNVTARANPEEIAYSADYSELDYITGLPFLAVVGARWSR
jgi:hypothetical protein